MAKTSVWAVSADDDSTVVVREAIGERSRDYLVRVLYEDPEHGDYDVYPQACSCGKRNCRHQRFVARSAMYLI